MMYEGNVTNINTCEVEIVAVAEQHVLATSTVDNNGHWTLKTDDEANWIIAQCRHSAVAASAATATENAQLTLPELIPLEFELEGNEDDITAWLDPVELQDFPNELIWSLFARPGRLLEMHVAEFAIPADGKTVTIPVQQGKYRLSGGTVALHPNLHNPAIQLSSITDITSGKHINAENGQVIIDVENPAKYRLHFEAVTFPEENITINLSIK